MNATTDTGSVELWLASAGLACTLGPIAAAVWWHRRSGAPYRAFAYGALVFFLFQIVLRLPWQIPLASWAYKNTAWQLPFLLLSALTAGLFEEGGRYAGYRWWLRQQWNARAAVMYGLGHGGCEATLLVGVQLIVSAVALHLVSQGVIETPVAVTALRQLASTYTPGTAVAALVERASAIALHVGLALVVLQAVVRSQLRWIALAIAIHFAVDAVAAWLTTQLHASTWMVEALLLGMAILTLMLGVGLARQRETAAFRSA